MNRPRITLAVLSLSCAFAANTALAGTETGKPLTRQEVTAEYLRAQAAGELEQRFAAEVTNYPNLRASKPTDRAALQSTTTATAPQAPRTAH